MDLNASNSPTEPPVVSEMTALLERARQGDLAVLPELRRVLEERPELWEHYGNLAAHVETLWLNLIAGSNLHLRESVAFRLAELKAELAGPTPTPLESLLVERAAACWLQLQHADAAAAPADSTSLRVLDFYQKRQDRAHRRYLTALGALATVRKLLPSASTSPVKRLGSPEMPAGPALKTYPPA